MPRARRLPIEEYLIDLEEAGVELPDGLPLAEAYRLAAAASFFLARAKRVTIADPARLLVVDRKTTVEVDVVASDASGLPALFAARAPAARARPHRSGLWVDATATTDPEFAFEHALFGEVTLYRFPSKPKRTTDERVLAAERAGWGPVLKTFSLLPGRGIVVEDGRQGLLVTHADAAAFAGLAVHTAGGEAAWYPNPFVEGRFADAEFQFWLQWGEGVGETEWRTVVEERGE